MTKMWPTPKRKVPADVADRGLRKALPRGHARPLGEIAERLYSALEENYTRKACKHAAWLALVRAARRGEVQVDGRGKGSAWVRITPARRREAIAELEADEMIEADARDAAAEARMDDIQGIGEIVRGGPPPVAEAAGSSDDQFQTAAQPETATDPPATQDPPFVPDDDALFEGL